MFVLVDSKDPAQTNRWMHECTWIY